MADGGGPIPSGLGRTVRSAPTAGGSHPPPDDYHPPPHGQAAEEAHVRSTPVTFSTTNAHTMPSMARWQLMTTGAAPSKAKTLKNDLLPVSGRLSISGRGVKPTAWSNPAVGLAPK